MTTPLSSPNVPIHKTQRFEDFYRLFEEKPGVFKYQDQISDIFSKGGNTLLILYEDLLAFDSQIAEMLRKDPESLFEDAIDAFKNILKFQGAKITDQYYFVRITTKDEKSPLNILLRGLRAKHIDNLVCSNGILVRSSAIRPKLVKATFECMICGAQFEVIQLTAKIKWPKFCTNKRCKARSQSDFRLVSKTSEFIDWQSIVIQEIPEDLPPGRIPRSVQAILTYDLVDSVKPGDRVKVMGVFKSVLAQSTKGMNSTLFKTYIDVNYIDPEDKSDELIDLSKEEKIEIEKLSKEPLIQKKIARSIAPSIYGREELKMACSLSLFAGTRKRKSGGGYKRGDIHVLFVGDPGTGKSVHGSEKIYVGKNKNKFIDWKVKKIGNFIDDLIDQHKNRLISNLETEVLYLTGKNLYTYSINPITLKTQKTRIKEVSRHKAKILVRIETNSGRTVLATPNHSFSTINKGKLETIDISQLNNENYLPIARNLNFPEIHQKISLNNFFEEQELVYLKKIKDNISSFKSKNITLKTAAIASNIAQGTVLSYIRKPYTILDQDLIRHKYDITWIPKDIELDDRFGRIVGFFLAEGDVIKNSIRITNYNSELLNLIEQDFFDIFQRVSRYDDVHNIQFHNSSLSKIFKHFFGTGAENKKVPDKFLYTPYQFRRNLLSAYFTGDGFIEQEGLYLSALTKSKSLAYSISDLLSTVDIFAKIGEKIVRNGKYKGNLYYKIILTGQDVIRFCEKIGFLSSEKQKKLEKVVKSSSLKSRYQAKDIIPNFGDLLIRISKDLELKGKRNTWQRNLLGELRGKTQRQRAGRIYLKKIVTLMENFYKKQEKKIGNDLIWLKQLTESDIFWDKIKTIDIINKETYVYDIGTDDGHFILAKGNLIVHNSEILKGAIEVSPRGLYTSGKGSTGVGLTAAVIKDNETGQMNLEAGAVVLANGGVACLSGESMLSFDNEIVRIKNLFNENLMFNAYSKGEQIEISNLEGEISSINSNLDVINSKTSKIRRKMYNGRLIEIEFRSGYKIQLTPDHKLLDGNILEWKQAKNFKEGDLVVAPLRLPKNTNPIFILDIIPNNWLIILNNSQKLQLKKIIYKKYKTLREFNEKYEVSRHFLSGGNQLKAEQIRRILRDLNIYDVWKYKTLKYGRISSGEILKVDKITPELAYFLGFIFGDGHVKITSRRSTIEIKQSLKNEKQIKKLREIFIKFSRRKLREYKKKESNKIEGRFVESKCVNMRPDSNLIAYLYEYITGNNLKNLFKLPNESLKGFLAGCLDSDGCVSIKNSKKGNNVYKTAHIEFLISNVEEENLAIMSALRKLNCFGRLIRGSNISRIRITGREDVKILIRELNNYSVKIKEIPHQKHIVSSFSDKIPKVPVSLLSKKIISTVNTTLLLKTGIWSVLHAYKDMQYQPSRKQLQKIKSRLFEFLDKETLDYIDILTNRNYFLDEIIKMDIYESNQYVYDLYVPDLHNFVCDGIFVHNCIDEFDKMDTADRSALHESMEQQTVSIAKAGIVATLKAQTAIIAAANPRSGRYDRYKTPTQNINLPPSLLSRFDLIFVVVDKPNPADDAQMAEFILRSAMVNPNEIDNENEKDIAPISPELLKKYIKHARKACHPVLSEESKEKIKEFYLELRGQYDSEDAIVSILARNLDALVRLTEAHAKMALREKVLKEDVEAIIKLFKRYLKDTGYDETTGKIDMDRILVGQSRSSINKLDKLLTRLKEIFEENKWKALEKTNIIPILALEEELDEKWIKDALDELVREGTLYEPRTNMIKFTNKDE